MFLWDKEQGFRVLERFDDPPHSGGLCINIVGQIVGTMADPNGNQQGFLRDPDGSKRCSAPSAASKAGPMPSITGDRSSAVPKCRTGTGMRSSGTPSTECGTWALLADPAAMR